MHNCGYPMRHMTTTKAGCRPPNAYIRLVALLDVDCLCMCAASKDAGTGRYAMHVPNGHRVKGHKMYSIDIARVARHTALDKSKTHLV